MSAFNLGLPEHSIILGNIMSQLDLLTIYNKFYITMRDFFNDPNILFIIARKYNLNGNFAKLVDILLEHDMIYGTNYIYSYDFKLRFLYLMKQGRIDVVKKFTNYYYTIMDEIYISDNIDNLLEYFSGFTGIENLLTDPNETKKSNLPYGWYDLGIEVRKNNIQVISEDHVTRSTSDLIEKTKLKLIKLAELDELDKINNILSNISNKHRLSRSKIIELISSIMEGACISNNLNLIKKIFCYKYGNKEIIKNIDDFNIEQINPKHLEYLRYTAYLSLNNFLIIEKLLPLDYYKIAENCCLYWGNCDVFGYVIKKLGKLSKTELLELVIENERVDILKCLLGNLNLTNKNLYKLLKKSLNMGRYGSASLIWSNTKITAIDLFTLVCKVHQRLLTQNEKLVIAGEEIYWCNILKEWFISRINPDEIENNTIIKNRLDEL
jgi:hypothetical protein